MIEGDENDESRSVNPESPPIDSASEEPLMNDHNPGRLRKPSIVRRVSVSNRRQGLRDDITQVQDICGRHPGCSISNFHWEPESYSLVFTVCHENDDTTTIRLHFTD